MKARVAKEDPMDLQIDHVTVAGQELDRLGESFSQAGLEAEYGGRHSNGVTHMSVVGFRDGSYLELISTVNPDEESPWWNDPIHGDGGPCAWAVRVDDIETVSADLADRGIIVDGPNQYERVRDDGTLVEWDLTTLGEGELGSTLPFLISDRTPRERRVQPTGGLAESPVHGVDTVILGVPDLEAASEEFETAFEMTDPNRGDDQRLSATVASYPDQPVALVEPQVEGFLADRIDEFGPRPVGYLLRSDGEITSEFSDAVEDSFMGRPVEWLSITDPVGCRYIGVVPGSE